MHRPLEFLKNVWDRYDSGYNLLSFLYYRDSLVIWCLSFHFPLQSQFYLYIWKKKFPSILLVFLPTTVFLCTQKSVTKRSSYSECVKMCLEKQRSTKKKKLKPRLNVSEPKGLQWLKVRKFIFIRDKMMNLDPIL